jgi:hypothetical protein
MESSVRQLSEITAPSAIIYGKVVSRERKGE